MVTCQAPASPSARAASSNAAVRIAVCPSAAAPPTRAIRRCPSAARYRTASVTALELVAAAEDDRRRGYRATVATATGPPGAAASPVAGSAYVVLARQPDGRWLVVADSPDLGEGDD